MVCGLSKRETIYDDCEVGCIVILRHTYSWWCYTQQTLFVISSHIVSSLPLPSDVRFRNYSVVEREISRTNVKSKKSGRFFGDCEGANMSETRVLRIHESRIYWGTSRTSS